MHPSFGYKCTKFQINRYNIKTENNSFVRPLEIAKSDDLFTNHVILQQISLLFAKEKLFCNKKYIVHRRSNRRVHGIHIFFENIVIDNNIEVKVHSHEPTMTITIALPITVSVTLLLSVSSSADDSRCCYSLRIARPSKRQRRR